MKVFVPRNIEKGYLNMNFQIGFIKVSLIQLVILASGLGIGIAVWNGVARTGGDKTIATIFAVITIIPFLVIAFFNVSELSLIPFLSKIIRNRFLDVTKKKQTNQKKINPVDILLKESQATHEHLQKKEQKTLNINDFKKQKKLGSDEILS